MTTATTLEREDTCLYCGGDGYYQLLLGGSETCESCGGTGKKTQED
ncbi:hypothetical protein JIR001_07090 [Polycladomyces abyssicola]|jgi:DnaJ-class molecular chaperone|uniref:YuiA family protein n=1 Tax=Polycladomyces abyssicola TaxID=1125966 RepID=A0A8D5ZN18_9BACL|nr:YuiA family protein [Polycladomyces abyssicola]BCU80926.1 hypothetical protein JIR001_07090 [Polycladomyces abyssicola]